MTDAEDEPVDERSPVRGETETSGRDGPSGDGGPPGDTGDADLDELRAAVEEKYEFENFGPASMAEMSIDEWQAAFDPETWITGEALLDRIEADLKHRIADREVFARIDRYDDPPRLLAYANDSYAMVYPDGSVEGEGTVMRDVKPTVALCSMDSYDVPAAPDGPLLPEPGEIPEQTSELGNNLLQVIGGVLLLAGVALVGAGIFQFGNPGANALLLLVAGLGFFVAGVFLFVVVANARLSHSFRAEEYRERLRGVGLEDGERPDFLPPAPGAHDESARGEQAKSHNSE